MWTRPPTRGECSLGCCHRNGMYLPLPTFNLEVINVVHVGGWSGYIYGLGLSSFANELVFVCDVNVHLLICGFK